MRLLMVALAALPLSAAAAGPPVRAANPVAPAALSEPARCPTLLGKDGKLPEARTRKLGELPPADAFHAVYRLDGEGCIDPVMVGYQFGRRR